MTNEQGPAEPVVNDWLTREIAYRATLAWNTNYVPEDLKRMRAELPPLVLRATFDELAASQRAMDDLNASACGSMAREINALRARVAELEREQSETLWDGNETLGLDGLRKLCEWAKRDRKKTSSVRLSNAQALSVLTELEARPQPSPAPAREPEPDYWTRLAHVVAGRVAPSVLALRPMSCTRDEAINDALDSGELFAHYARRRVEGEEARRG